MLVLYISEIENVSTNTVLSVLTKSDKKITPKQKYYNVLEIDEFWTYVGNKKTKVWLIYAYHRTTGEIVAWVFGKRDYKTAKKLREKITKLRLTFCTIATDNWDSFVKAFSSDNHIIGKKTYYWN